MATGSKIDAYVFDLDGTLATIPVDWDGVREGLQSITGDGREFKPVFPSIGEVVAERPKLRRPIFELIDRFEMAAVPSTRLYEGTIELLTLLSEHAKVGLVTMQGRSACTKVMEVFGLKQYFLRYYTREDSMDRAEQLGMAIASMRSSKDSSLFIGDRFNDLNAAKKAGVRFTMIRTHGDDPGEEEGVEVYHSVTEFLSTLTY